MTKLSKNLIQLWFSGFIAEFLTGGVFIVGMFLFISSWQSLIDAPLYHFFLQKELLFLLLLSIFLLSFVIPYYSFREQIRHYFDLTMYKNMVVIAAIIFVGHLIHYLVPEDVHNIRSFLLWILFIGWIYFLLLQSKFFYQSTIDSFNIPTTLSMPLLSILLSGMGIFIIAPFEEYSVSTALLLIFLLFDLLTLIAGFKYLKEKSFIANQILKEYFTVYFIFLLLRVIVGIFLPLIFIIIHFFSSASGIVIIGPFLIFGQLIKIYLFLFVHYTGTEQRNKHDDR
ncbi:MAG: hypothetical protein Kow00108_19920 [Calditrichia bacterium]